MTIKFNSVDRISRHSPPQLTYFPQQNRHFAEHAHHAPFAAVPPPGECFYYTQNYTTMSAKCPPNWMPCLNSSCDVQSVRRAARIARDGARVARAPPRRVQLAAQLRAAWRSEAKWLIISTNQQLSSSNPVHHAIWILNFDQKMNEIRANWNPRVTIMCQWNYWRERF